MLSEAPIRPDAVCLGRVLDYDLVVDPLIPVGDHARVARQQPRVDSDLRDVKRVRAREGSQAVHSTAERAKRAVEDVRAVADLAWREVRLADKKARFPNELRNADDLFRPTERLSVFCDSLGECERRLTLENQFVFQNPGVPHGHAGRPPESRQPGTVKSFANQ